MIKKYKITTNNNGDWCVEEYINGVISGEYIRINKDHWIKREYNNIGLLIGAIHNDGYCKKYQYNKRGLKIKKTDNNGGWKKYKYNKQGLLIEKKTSDGDWEKYEYV